MSERSDILMVGQTPPPYHGQAVVTAMLFKHKWPGLKVERLRMAYSDDLESVGGASWRKLLRLIQLVVQTWVVVIKKNPHALYYLPASPNTIPVLRDIVYLGMVRWLFPKTILHFHAGGLEKFVKQNPLIGWFVKQVYGGADMCIDVNVTEPPTGSFFAAKQNEIVMNGLDVGKADRQRPSDNITHLLYVGLLCEAKGVLELVDIAKLLQNRDISCVFVMVGAWESEAFKLQFNQSAAVAGVDKMFCFKGELSGSSKWQAYADADVFLFPTFHPTETFGLVLIEAMAFGLPSVTTNWRGIPFVVEGGDCSILCDVKSPYQYADALEGLLLNKSKRDSMGHAARAHYEKNYTKDRFVTSMEAVFRSVLNTGS